MEPMKENLGKLRDSIMVEIMKAGINTNQMKLKSEVDTIDGQEAGYASISMRVDKNISDGFKDFIGKVFESKKQTIEEQGFKYGISDTPISSNERKIKCYVEMHEGDYEKLTDIDRLLSPSEISDFLDAKIGPEKPETKEEVTRATDELQRIADLARELESKPKKRQF